MARKRATATDINASIAAARLTDEQHAKIHAAAVESATLDNAVRAAVAAQSPDFQSDVRSILETHRKTLSAELFTQVVHTYTVNPVATRLGGQSSASETGRTIRVADAPPTDNMGGTSDGSDNGQYFVVTDDGDLKYVPRRFGHNGDAAFIDWLNITVHETSFQGGSYGQTAVDDVATIYAVSAFCERIFGFGIFTQMPRGANFYKRAYRLGDSDSNYGLICHGGQRNSLMISISGLGCTAAKPGWEQRLYDWLKHSAVTPKITRADVAYDDYDGTTYSVDRAHADYDAGLFQNVFSPKNPEVELRGNWKKPSGRGRTIYVGLRRSGMMARVYEKGRQLGCSSSEWQRIEVEFKSVDRLIPFEILLEPGKYLAGSYPAFAWINKTQCRVTTFKKTAESTLENMIGWAKRQLGPLVNALMLLQGDDTPAEQAATNVIGQIRRDGVPKRLIFNTHEHCEPGLHHWPRLTVPVDTALDAAFA